MCVQILQEWPTTYPKVQYAALLHVYHSRSGGRQPSANVSHLCALIAVAVFLLLLFLFLYNLLLTPPLRPVLAPDDLTRLHRNEARRVYFHKVFQHSVVAVAVALAAAAAVKCDLGDTALLY